MKYLFQSNKQDCQQAKYILCKTEIGNGSYSSVFECKNSITGRHYAVKKYKKRLMYGLESMIRNEFKVLKSVSMTNSNILSLIDYFETDDNIYLVTDLAMGRDLFDRIVKSPNEKLVEDDAREITYSLVSAVEYLHNNSIIHRDVKAENLLFKSTNSNEILLGDFGLARVLQPHEKLYDVSGTLSYMAPEILNRKLGYSYTVDIWAIGVALYFMLCGYLPFDCDSDAETKYAIKNRLYLFHPPEFWSDISSPAKDFIQSCFEADPRKRPQAMSLLQHPFLLSTSLRMTNSFDDLSRIGSSNSLKQQVQIIHENSPTSSSSFPGSSKTSCSTLLERGRLESLKAGASSFGDLCFTPKCVSAFNSPLISPLSSRNASTENLTKNNLDLHVAKTPPQFYI